MVPNNYICEIPPHAVELLMLLYLIECNGLQGDPEILTRIRELLFLGDGTFFMEFYLG
jgi:hypothetical protein